MWPGQQPPGGEQNPQDQNPYQQPGYQQPNPYQQPGYQQPNPYQQPTAPQYAVPGQMPGAPMPPQDDKKKTTIVAIVAATAVVVAAAVTGFVVLKDDDEGTSDKGGGTTASKTPGGDKSSEPAPSPSVDNPRDGSDAKPTIAGWKVVTNPKHGTQFDVPPEWEVAGSGMAHGFEDEKKGDGSAVVMMSAPAYYKSKWCEFDTDKDGKPEDWGLSTVGTKGGKGAKSAAEAAYNEAGNWVWAGYAQTEPKGTVKITKAKDYTTASGLKGSVSTATALGVKKENKCETDGKSIAFSFKDPAGDFKSWVLYANTGVKDEVDDATIQKILSTVRLVEATESGS
ncbi:hypothetical protein ACF08N_21835 [Streptomyces sp. NPDC015127]|uniref:hypothetical protein n=1 Tax=Streptomyces sp. NPDC015127 TaxID=3364939 RepID=UPI0036FF86C1